MRKRLVTGLAATTAGVAAAYAVPAPTRPFDDLFADVDGATRDGLAEFRAHHVPYVVDIGRALWRFVALGAGDETVLFLHGMGGAHDIWWQQLTALADRYRVIAVTYPPVGSLEELAAGAEAVLRTEGIDAAHIVGTSLGGYLAQYLVATRPAMVSSAVFANTFPPNELLRRQHRNRAMAARLLPAWLVMRAYASKIREQVVPASGGAPLVAAYLLEQAYGGMTRADLVARYACVLEDFAAPDPAVPVLLIVADNDPLVSEELRGRLRVTYPQAEMVTLEGVGHFPYLNEPAAYNGTLERFLGSVG